MVGKSSSPISTLLRPSGKGRPVASVVSATETEGAMAVVPAGARSSSPIRDLNLSSRGSQSENQTGVPFSSQS